MLPEVTQPHTFAELEAQVRHVKALPDGVVKLGKVHALGVYCRSHANFMFSQIFQSQLGPDLMRLQAFWGLRNGQQLLAEHIARTGGAA